MKTGVIDVGGGLRGIYAAGVFDYCLDAGVTFDIGIGVSAGSANIAAYLAGQKGRNYLFYTDYSFRKEYMSFKNFVRKKSYIDMDYLYGTLSNSTGENPLDYPAIVRNSAQMLVVATNAQTGEAVYFQKDDLKQDNYDIFKASCSIPFVCRPYEINGVPYYDGALSDPVPIEKAFACGCDKVVVILTKPEAFIRNPAKDEKIARRIQKKYPASAENLRKRAENYNRQVALAKQYRDQGRAIIIAPDDTCGVDTLTRDREALQRFYKKGYQDAQAIPEFLKQDGGK
ncbi:patatin-like phospholipase family protein [Marvinbryantia formatexigens]|nr:patatin family protein [Marvinbryantia formatexigens]UWO25774.1 patatin family protein [Marvinbryantia formatexigens DSM 14469]SDF36603.1 Predicted phospholipase, patatin/cPLA2 family [Marvinbryantia formatexigens]